MASDFLKSDSPFSIKTFDLIEQLYKSKNQHSSIFYQKNIQKFKKYIEDPFQNICTQVLSQLPDEITKQIDLEHRLFQYSEYKGYEFSIPRKAVTYNKNETELFIIIRENLYFGLYIGEGSSDKQQFINNYHTIKKNKTIMHSILLPKSCFLYTKKNWDCLNCLECWLRHLAEPNSVTQDIQASVHLELNEVLQSSGKQLSTQITHTFEQLFPLFLLATCQEPISALKEYLNFREPLIFPSNYQSSILFEQTRLKLYEDTRLEPEYKLTQGSKDTGFEEVKLKCWIRAIERKKQAIFYGSPGTGKTFIAEKIAQHLIGRGGGFSELIQFHPAYSYEDFIQGIRPQSQDGQLTYPLVPGRFLEFCKKAESRQGLCVLIIDEINRANLAQVFGELMYLLEYRDKKIRLAGSNELFGIPENVRIIGTMNTADRSIALVDHALRRRFAFIELRPNYNVLRRYHEKQKTGFEVDGLIETLKRLNNAIANKHYEIGISFFLTENLPEELEDIWQMEIEPYLEEYFFDQLDTVEKFRWEKVKQQVCP